MFANILTCCLESYKIKEKEVRQVKIKVPDYFVKFRCIADRCKDSCCIGWEIDIDDITKAKYQALNTEIGHEIVEKTKHGCFPLQENGRCAFLDENGLCRIISSHGDGYLCDICREHPRYYGVGKDGIEGGLGLGCEEAARIILGLCSLPKITEIERDVHYEDGDPLAEVSEEFRSLLSDGIFTSDAEDLISRYTAYAAVADEVAFEASAMQKSVKIPKVTHVRIEKEESERMLCDYLDLLSECEYMSEGWQGLIAAAKSVDTDRLIEGTNSAKGLLYYFTHRYVREGVEDMSLGQRILFALLSTLAIIAISAVTDTEEPIVRATVLFSKNIEYSTDNVDMILDNLSSFL